MMNGKVKRIKKPKSWKECSLGMYESSSVIVCPCCYGWGEHQNIKPKHVEKWKCTLCKGKRLVIERKTFEPVEDLVKVYI